MKGLVQLRRVLLATALTGAALVVLSGTAAKPRLAVEAMGSRCVQSVAVVTHASGEPKDNDTPPESEVIAEQANEQKELGNDLDQHKLPSGELAKGADDQVHTKLAKGSVEIPVYVHVVHDGAIGKVPTADIKKQIDVLNHDFAAGNPSVPTAFSFQLAATDYTDNKVWFQSLTGGADETAMKTKLHKGNASTLNIYLTSASYKKPGDSKLLGVAAWPKDYAGAPNKDGVVLKYSTLPGGTAAPFNQGKTATHEVGHWLGLYHTFQGGCDKPGDEVSDTPSEAESASGCPKNGKSCPTSSGDPVHNYMDYSDDSCLNQFSKGQSQRMNDEWAAYRQAKSKG